MEEADGRIILHVFDMVKSGLKDVLIRTVDTDVLVLAISFVHKLRDQGLATLWVKLGTGAKVKQYAAHNIAEALGEQKAVALRGFHAFTGCDEVSFMAGKGKKTAWNAWNAFPAATEALFALSHPLEAVPESVINTLEKFTIRLYDAKSKEVNLNAVRRDQYDGVKSLTKIPTTKHAFLQHVNRAAYQAGHVWGQAHLAIPSPVDITKWGWIESGTKLLPFWSTLPDVWEKCQLKKKCHCKKKCLPSRCPCLIAGIPCKYECRCKGACCQPPKGLVKKN